MQVGDSKSPILLVESDAKDEMRAVRAYQETGHTNRLLVARTAEHAMTLLKACSKGLRFGLVLIDLYAPRLGAADLIRRIRREPGLMDVPLVVLAPENVNEQSLCGVAGDATTWARKPSNRAEYCTLLDRLVQAFLGVRSKSACKEANTNQVG
jgi:CheY-like chemotaxis protein